MQKIKKNIIYYVSTFLVSFSLGLIFDHYVLCQYSCLDDTGEQLEIILQEQENEDKIAQQEKGCTIYVDASGALVDPGVYCLENGALVIDAVNKAGGFSKDAATRFIARRMNLAQELVNNQKLYFPYETELVCEFTSLTEEAEDIEAMLNDQITELPTTEPYSDQTSTPSSSENSSGNGDSTDTQCVNINTATKDELIELNGVGESTAGKIIEGRPYTAIEDLLNISGIGDSTFEKFKDEICI